MAYRLFVVYMAASLPTAKVSVISCLHFSYPPPSKKKKKITHTFINVERRHLSENGITHTFINVQRRHLSENGITHTFINVLTTKILVSKCYLSYRTL